MENKEIEGWDYRAKPSSLSRRFEFSSYAQTRDFLDRLDQLSQQTGLYPHSTNFGTGYVNLTIDLDVDAEAYRAFAAQVGLLYRA
jgi:4a-hydroxytetrahydrobiopterin dehydratase